MHSLTVMIVSWCLDSFDELITSRYRIGPTITVAGSDRTVLGVFLDA